MTYRQMITEMHRIIQAAGGQIPIPVPSLPLCLRYLNQALQYANELTDYLLKIKTFDNVSDAVYDTQFTEIYQVWWNDTRLYRQLEITAVLGNYASAATPSYYIHRAGRLAVFPAPNTAGELKVAGIAKHPIISENDLGEETEFPTWIHQYIVYLAAGYYLMAFPEQMQRAQAYIEKAEQSLLLLRQRVNQERMYEIAPANTLQGWVYQIVHRYLNHASINMIDAMIQQAYNHYFGFMNAVIDTVEITIPPNTTYVDLQTHSIIEVYRVFVNDADWRLLPNWDGNWQMLCNRFESGKPQQYIAYGNRIEIFPKTDASYILRIEGAIIPSSNPQSYIPKHLHFSIAEYAAGLMLMSEYTEKGQSVGMMYRTQAMMQWQEWRRQQIANSYSTNEYTHEVLAHNQFPLRMGD